MTHAELIAEAVAPPMLTAEWPGIGGRIKVVPEDFEVEEIPAYTPCGQGEHLYLWIEKREVGAEFFTRELSRRLNISAHDIGTAGHKDRRAVTRQWVSVPARVEARLSAVEDEGIHVLQVNRHTNKLKPGHLTGNRFRVLIREPNVAAATDEAIGAILTQIHRQGLPNYFGTQRFGHGDETAHLGFSLLTKEVKRAKSNFLRKLALSAVQSVLFNVYLGRRVRDGLFRRVLDGDVMTKWPRGGLFVVEDIAREQERFDARETVTAGPIFGRKTFASRGEAQDREASVLQNAGLNLASFHGFGELLQGTRRANLVYLDDLHWQRDPDGVTLRFSLPAGSYATVLLCEVMKVTVEDADHLDREP